MNRISLVLLVAASATACTPQTLKVAPVQVAPIHVVIDVNLHDPAPAPATAPQKH